VKQRPTKGSFWLKNDRGSRQRVDRPTENYKITNPDTWGQREQLGPLPRFKTASQYRSKSEGWGGVGSSEMEKKEVLRATIEKGHE